MPSDQRVRLHDHTQRALRQSNIRLKFAISHPVRVPWAVRSDITLLKHRQLLPQEQVLSHQGAPRDLVINRSTSTKSNSTRLIVRAQCLDAFSQIDKGDMTL